MSITIVSITISLFVIAVSVYALAYRPLPATSGSMIAPISAPALITRDALGVPHIDAATEQDALFLQGYATAQDRLWQMDNLRRFAEGDLAEVYGTAALEQDILSRTMQMRPIAERSVKALTSNEVATLSAYARGVNFFISNSRGRLPLEFRIPHSYQPRPWSPVDSILILLVMHRDLTSSWQTDLARASLFASASDPAKARKLFPPTEGDYLSPGSNSWAVTGRRSADGKPLLASDPHLDHSIPSIWHMVHLKAPGLNVIGVALPGVPGVTIGHNDHIAWGMTNIGADYQDLYEEKFDVNTGRYWFKGEEQRAALDRQRIEVYGAKSVEIKTWITRHGPLMLYENGKKYALRWTAADGVSFPVLALNHARNWEEFRAALQRMSGPPQNLTYADRVGNIGYQATGAMPIRKNFQGDVPLDGSSGAFEWSGYVPFDQLPSYFNPADGLIATANQNPFPPEFPYAVEGNFADVYRVEQIRSRLNSKSKLTVNDMLSIETDVYSAYHHFLARRAALAIERMGLVNGPLGAADSLFLKWDGQMDRREAAPLAAELLHREISTWLLRSVAPGTKTTLNVRPHRIQRLVEERPTGWVEDNNWDRWLLERLASALQNGEKEYGTPINHWQYGKALQWEFKHPLGSHLPLVSSFFDIGPVPMSGAATTVKQTGRLLGPSMRMIVDWGDVDRSVQNLATGESGEVASPHYKDQWEAYYWGRSFPMQFTTVNAVEQLKILPQH